MILKISIRFLFIVIFPFYYTCLSGQDSLIYKEGKAHYTKIKYNKKGQKTREIIFIDGNKTSIKKWKYSANDYEYLEYPNLIINKNLRNRSVFYNNGKIKIRGTQLKNKNHGKIESFYRNGQIKNICYFSYGKLDGVQVHFYDNGQLHSEYEYKNGKLWSALSRYKRNGISLHPGNLSGGHGSFYYYDYNGILLWMGHFRKGKLVYTEDKIKKDFYNSKNLYQDE